MDVADIVLIIVGAIAGYYAVAHYQKSKAVY